MFLDSSTSIVFHSIVIWASSVHILVDLKLLLTTQGFLYADTSSFASCPHQAEVENAAADLSF
jgi:hypothetical protein